MTTSVVLGVNIRAAFGVTVTIVEELSGVFFNDRLLKDLLLKLLKR